MADPRLLLYLSQLRNQGYSNSQIKFWLTQYGYPPKEIDSALKELENRSAHAQRVLLPYLREQLSKGYDLTTLRIMLLQCGYTAMDIDSAIAKIMANGKITHEVHISTKTLISIFALFACIALLGITIYLFFVPQSAEQLLDYQIEIEKEEYAPGDTIVFFNRFTNTGSNKRYDIIIEYRIIDLNRGKTIRSWGETIGIDMVDTNSARYTIPQKAKPGLYKIEGNARVGKERVTAYQTFSVISPVTKNNIPIEDKCRNNFQDEGEERVDCGGPCEPCEIEEPIESCFDGILNQDEVEIDCGGTCRECEQKNESKVTKQEIFEAARSTARTKPDEAVKICKEISDALLEDECYLKVAEISNISETCSNIKSIARRDSCYMLFVTQGDFKSCKNISDSYIRMSCEALIEIKKTPITSSNPSMEGIGTNEEPAIQENNTQTIP